MFISELRYARSGDVDIAYQQYGEGPDLLIIPGLICNVELAWEEETYRRAREHIGKHLRVTEFDKRGMGSSDRFDETPTLEQRIEDITAVLDAEGIKRCHVVGLSEGGIMAQLFAVQHPERVNKLVLVNSLIGVSGFSDTRFEAGDPYMSSKLVKQRFDQLMDGWGREPEHFVDLFTPSKAGDAAFARWVGRFQRQTCSRTDVQRQYLAASELDANDRLGDISAPTQVLNVVGDRAIPPAFGRYLAARIPGAEYRQFEGEDHLQWMMPTWRDMIDHWLEFLTGSKVGRREERRFATVLFTDIVNSTARGAEVGDAAWSQLLNRHDRIAWAAVDKHDGNLVKNTGDGLLMTFTAPSQAVACASDLIGEFADAGLTVRAGLHAGEIMVRDDGDVSGLAVNLAARVQEVAEGGTLMVSSTVHDLLLGGEWTFSEEGEHTLKGIDGTWRLYQLTS